jgi:hypothetical protein
MGGGFRAWKATGGPAARRPNGGEFTSTALESLTPSRQTGASAHQRGGKSVREIANTFNVRDHLSALRDRGLSEFSVPLLPNTQHQEFVPEGFLNLRNLRVSVNADDEVRVFRFSRLPVCAGLQLALHFL